MASKVAFHTLGCKLNFSETSTIGNQFLKEGFEIVDFDQKAEVYVINTCTVTENADKECRQIVRRAQRLNPDAFIAVTGCYAQLRPEEISKIKGVDAILGSDEKYRIFNHLNNFQKREFPSVFVSPTEELRIFNSAYSTEADNRTRAFFKIQDGCDYKCSFCTIPLARGSSRSPAPDQVLHQFRSLLDIGYKEVILTGVNIGDYGNSSDDFYHLLQSMLKVEGEYRIRISSIEPNLLSDEIIDLTASNAKLCNHFHIPLQSGSTKILRLMKRRYTVDDYYNLIIKACDKIEDLGIGADVITGFPGETEENFIETYSFLRDLPISYLHVFTYSGRPNTKAAGLDNQVDMNERKGRTNRLRILSGKKRNDFYRSMIGKELSVLFEHGDHQGDMKGFASNYVRVKRVYKFDLINKFLKVKIENVIDNICVGNYQHNHKPSKILAG